MSLIKAAISNVFSHYLSKTHRMSRLCSASLSKSSQTMESMGERAKEKVQNSWRSAKETFKEHGDDKESILKEHTSTEEDDHMKKLQKEPGGKPMDEDKGLDVNWRPIDENKS